MFTAQIKTISGSAVALPFGVRLDPLTYSWSVYGGPLQADLRALGPIDGLWSLMANIGKRIEIYDDDQTPVWWGIIEEVLVNRDGLTDGLSIREMYNKIKVVYTYDDGSDTLAAETEWATHAACVNACGFTKEFIETLSQNATAVMAEARRDNLLDRLSRPSPVSEAGNAGEIQATLHCVGDFHSLGWRYYEQPLGLEFNEGGLSSVQEVGQGLASDLIGFTSGGKIHDLGGRFQGDVWRVGAQVRNTGSAKNNVVGIVIQTDPRQLVNHSTAQISFEANDDITDSTNGSLTFLETDDIIRVTGTSSSNGTRRVKSADPEHVVVRGGNYTGESGPPNGIITRGNWVKIDSGIVNDTNEEFPNNTVTVQTFGNPCIQSFQITTASWTLNKIELRGYKIGSPTDLLRLELCQSSNGSISTVIESVTVPASAIAKEPATIAFQFANTTTLATNTQYWLRVTRTGGLNSNSYYVLEVDEEKRYTRGVFQVWDGVSYVPREPDCDLVFWATGAVETTTQIRDVVSSVGQFITKTDIRATSGIKTPQYRDGSKTGYDEIMELLSVGALSGGLLFARVTADQILQIYSPAATNNNDIQQLTANRYVDEAGRKLRPGYLPVGRWIGRNDIPLGGTWFHRLTPRLCEEAEYDCERREISSLKLLDTMQTSADTLFGVI